MAVTPVLASANGAPRISLAEWLTLRRHPHPDFVDSLDKLPASLAALVTQVLPAGQEKVEGILTFPPEYFARKLVMWEYVPERALVFLGHGVIYVVAEAPNAPARTVTIDAGALLYVRSSLLLLYGLLEFEADCGGQPGEVRLEYNTVIWQALREPLARFVAAACTGKPSEQGAQPAPDVREHNESVLKALPFKFANGLRYYSLGPGESIAAAVFQPPIWEQFGFFARQVTPNTLFALTDRKLILIEEKRASIWRRPSGQGEYGWIFTYIPLDRVVDMTINAAGDRSQLKLQVAWGEAREERNFLLEPAVARQCYDAFQAAHLSVS